MHCHSILFPASTSVSFIRRCNFNEKEIADGTLAFGSQRDQILFPVSSIKSEGNRRGRPPRRNTAADTSSEEKDHRVQKNADGEASASSNQKEIIALFRRIQSSISKGGSVGDPKSNTRISSSKQSPDAVLEVLRQYPSVSPVRGTGQADNKELRNQRSSKDRLRRKEEADNDSSEKSDFKLSRPASNFIKRSPIPSIASRAKVDNSQTYHTDTKVDARELQRVDEMKLPELRELAKSKGVKGFSKLKKAELVDLLKNSIKS